MRWGTRNKYGILVGKPLRKRPLENQEEEQEDSRMMINGS
jgi:hypothetical protein